MNKVSLYNEIQSKNKEVYYSDKDSSKLGIPLFIRKKRGRKTGFKKDNDAKDAFVEFVIPNSVSRLLKVAGTTGFMQLGIRTKIFKAGTKPDYIIVKKKKK